MKGILLACYVSGIRSLKDKSVTISLTTQEISPNIAGELFRLQDSLISTYIKEETIQQNEIDKVDKIDPEFSGKTHSQRLRNVFFKLFTQNSEKFKDFDSYYKSKMELVITHYKNLIE